MATRQTTKQKLELKELQAQHLDALAELGGRLLGEDDITFSGTKFVLPERVDLSGAIDFLVQRRDDEENDHRFSRQFPYRPYDGARATALAIREAFGFTLGQTLHTFFGRELPQLVDIKTGPGDEDREQVPWGAMRLPGMKGMTIHLTAAQHAEFGQIFQIVAEGPRKYRFHIEGLFKLIDKYLREDSIYKGKAIDGAEQFIDVGVVDPRDVVFTDSVQRRLEGDVWAFIKHSDLLDSLGHGGKFAVLFEGDYGTGKSLAAILTAQVAIANGWTFLMCRPGRDNLTATLEMARMYQPAVVFGEDVDTMAGPQSGDTIERYLDLLDGIKQKGLKLLAVFTTNHAEDIHKGMLRPGRIGAVIHVGAMERDGVERLTRRVIGDALDPEMTASDWDEVFEHVDGYMPAFVREVLDRSVRYAITLNDGELGLIGKEALCLAADGLRDQHKLMEEASEERVDMTLSTALAAVVTKAIDGTEVQDFNDDAQFKLVPSNGA